MNMSLPGRRHFIHGAAGTLAPLLALQAFGQSAAAGNAISLPPTAAATEPKESVPEPADAPADRVGFALVGLGHLTLERLMPAFGKTRHCKPVALVSGDRVKAKKLAAQHGIRDDAIYDYANFDRIAENLYCLNTARFLSGEEPTEVLAWMHSTPNDPRFTEVEETMHFLLRFPSGFQATCHTSYGAHKSQMLRLLGSEAWVELDPAYAYEGIKMRRTVVRDGKEMTEEPAIGEKDQFALEMDHMATCVRMNREPHNGGAEGLQDQRIVEAIYESAGANGRPVKIAQPTRPVRGPAPDAAAS